MDRRPPLDSFAARSRLRTPAGELTIVRLAALTERGVADVARLPRSTRVLLEALLRREDGVEVTREAIERLARGDPDPPAVAFLPARVLLQDFTGVPCVVDLAALRDAVARAGGDPGVVRPRLPVDLVVDHSVVVDVWGTAGAADENLRRELARNGERYALLRWARRAFPGLRVVPSGRGICHQVNLEHLASVVAVRDVDGERLAFPDSVLGTDSHTPMVNGLGVLGWGVGGIEAEAAMLGRPLVFPAPSVVGVRLEGRLPEATTATDLVLTITEMLRRHGVVGRFVEFCGPAVATLDVPARATLANMAPEYGATVGAFPIDARTLEYLRDTGRPPEQVELVERYARAQGLLWGPDDPDPDYAETLELDLDTVRPSVAGPRRPQQRIDLAAAARRWRETAAAPREDGGFGLDTKAATPRVPVDLESGERVGIGHGSVAIAAITSCTNTSNPTVMVAAGLLAKRAVEAGLRVPPWVKTSLAPGSVLVPDYLRAAGLLEPLERLGFHVVGYGCTTCIGNSGPLPRAVAGAVERHGLVVAAVLSGNRNFEGRIHPLVRASFLASPPLVVAYALAGRVDIDLATEPLGRRPDGTPVRLADLWPTPAEVAAAEAHAVDPERARRRYAALAAPETDGADDAPASGRFPWDPASTWVREPPFLLDLPASPPPRRPIVDARVLALLGDGISTDHISPAGAIPADGPAGAYLREAGATPEEFGSFGGRRGNHEVMIRGTFANVRLRNRLAPGREGGLTTHLPTGEVVAIFEAASRYRAAGIPTVVVGGRDYGMGSSRDWAAKGTRLLGVEAVLAESYERIHRSNLVGMGVLPLQFRAGEGAVALGITGRERFSIAIGDDLGAGDEVAVTMRERGAERRFGAICRLDGPVEVDTWRQGGILPAVLRGLLATSPADR